jgi:NADPH:quinone reductase-like Zn-dependent oxidoreductase
MAGEGLGGAEAHGPYWLVVESVGGPALGQALASLAQGGTCVSLGASGGAEVTFDARRVYLLGQATLYGFNLFSEFTRETPGQALARLLSLVAAGRLRTPIELEADWTEIGPVAQRFFERRFPGKAVLHLGA